MHHRMPSNSACSYCFAFASVLYDTLCYIQQSIIKCGLDFMLWQVGLCDCLGEIYFKGNKKSSPKLLMDVD